jgi:hypothetical protein
MEVHGVKNVYGYLANVSVESNESSMNLMQCGHVEVGVRIGSTIGYSSLCQDGSSACCNLNFLPVH